MFVDIEILFLFIMYFTVVWVETKCNNWAKRTILPPQGLLSWCILTASDTINAARQQQFYLHSFFGSEFKFRTVYCQTYSDYKKLLTGGGHLEFFHEKVDEKNGNMQFFFQFFRVNISEKTVTRQLLF